MDYADLINDTSGVKTQYLFIYSTPYHPLGESVINLIPVREIYNAGWVAWLMRQEKVAKAARRDQRTVFPRVPVNTNRR